MPYIWRQVLFLKWIIILLTRIQHFLERMNILVGWLNFSNLKLRTGNSATKSRQNDSQKHHISEIQNSENLIFHTRILALSFKHEILNKFLKITYSEYLSKYFINSKFWSIFWVLSGKQYKYVEFQNSPHRHQFGVLSGNFFLLRSR